MKDQSTHKSKGKSPDEIQERMDLKEILERKNLQNKVLKKVMDEIKRSENKQQK
jgi:hypothetical protein